MCSEQKSNPFKLCLVVLVLDLKGLNKSLPTQEDDRDPPWLRTCCSISVGRLFSKNEASRASSFSLELPRLCNVVKLFALRPLCAFSPGC